ncbi:hypothetical protein K2173_025095 [Erythroxylum novogranatense]|uniref:Uncharacterized protein n=1 Tax=Erythroxylum novogranatense TaxID=1862640 RepID=A0AAV8SVR7_9ROSI|nr:hypothetical protein K2173_025095 [Erythroxylum novogranatense]
MASDMPQISHIPNVPLHCTCFTGLTYTKTLKAQATRSPQERNTRVENMCWRIWNLARQKKQLEGELAQRNAKRRLERERGRRSYYSRYVQDLSEVVDMGHEGISEIVRKLTANFNSNMPVSHEEERKLIILMLQALMV